MARYLKLFTLQPRLYASGSPVIIESGALHKDTTLGDIVLQLKFRSLSRVDISELTVDVTCFDAAQQVVTSNFVYQYTDIINDEACEFFGQKTLITLPDVSTRSVVVRVTEVKFSDGSSVSVDNKDWESIPEQAELANFAPDLEKYLKDKYGEKSKVVPTEYKDLWLCICGQGNKKENTHCALCDLNYSSLFPFDIENVKKDATYETAKSYMKSNDFDLAINAFSSISGWQDADEQVELCKKKKVEKEEKSEIARKEAAKRVKRNCLIASFAFIIVCAVVAFVIVYNTVIIPNDKYDAAKELMNQGKYTEAILAFTELNGYKDSAEMIEACYIGMYSEEGWNILKNLSVGDTITLGSYQQQSSAKKEAIGWRVLKIEGSKVFVISEKVLDYRPYQDNDDIVTWETCSIRKWLNSEFYNAAFSDAEKKKIQTVKVTADQNPDDSRLDAGNDTEDKLFFLSVVEWREYDEIIGEEIIITDYVDSLSVYNVNWWLRTPDYGSGYGNKGIATFTWKGFVDARGSNTEEGVRPAMWIDLSK